MKNRKKIPSRKKRKKSAPQPQNAPFLLEECSLPNMRAIKKNVRQILEYQWRYYSELAHQRKAIESEISQILTQTSISDFSFKGWQRSVKYKYGLHPFCTVGSLTDPGGRFNIGDINPQNIPTFPALYLAYDKKTVLQETLGQVEVAESGLTSEELALRSPDSTSIVSVSGSLDKVFDTRSVKNLKKFVRLIKDFKISKELIEMAKRLNLGLPVLIHQSKTLHTELHNPDWRVWPMSYDIPSGSQIFGQLVYFAGIEGILYKSKLTGKGCLAIYPNNFGKSDSFIELDDEPPILKVPTRIDSKNFKICNLPFNEL